MTQKAIAELYQSTKQNISLHIRNIFEEKELDEDSVVKFYFTTARDGKNYKTKHYNLEMILAIGYRVRSHRGTQFRQWATERLNEYLVKGFTMDDDRLKEMRNFGQDYFDELLERIRDIRALEKRFYQKITDIYATSVDYDPKAEVTQEFFATVQNKLHFAIHGKRLLSSFKIEQMQRWKIWVLLLGKVIKYASEMLLLLKTTCLKKS
ncbi:RhuM family protein [Oceanobacillus luteolus]|uniref:RhuM family protein n=1 Tax=Oceanobacillus luteolus TaxID=1274358 RepID=A0ABW4HWJ8_9BACI|nr:RhuM family protein [Oceanobacillus luteolus]